MKKKALLTSAVAVATASAMIFSPVSYKVIDKASAATTQNQNVVSVAQKLQGVYGYLKSDAKLSGPFDIALGKFKDDIAELDIATDLPKLAGNISNDEDVELALVNFLQQVAADYTSNSTNLGDISADLEADIDALATALGTTINRNDVADLIVSIQEKLIAQVGEISLEDFIDEGALTTAGKDAIKNAITSEWNNNTNSAVSALKALYNGVLDDFISDLETASSNLIAPEDKATYVKGAAAFAIASAQYYFDQTKVLVAGSASSTKLNVQFKVPGSTVALPLAVLDWSSNLAGSTIEVDDTRDNYLVISKSAINLPQTVNVTAKINKAKPGFPSILDGFDGIELFTQSVTFNASFTGGGSDFVSSDLSLVSDYKAKADKIGSSVADYLAAIGSITNNTQLFTVKHLIEDNARQALIVLATSATTLQDGVRVLNLTPAQLDLIYSTQLDYVKSAISTTLTKHNLDIKVEPTLTFDISSSENGQFNLSADLIKSLLDKGISKVGLKSGSALVEVDLSQLDGAVKINIKKSATTIANAKSDVYSISVTDADGKAVIGFEKQFRITLPVTGASSEQTVAQVDDGSLTLIGGRAATGGLVFYSNGLGDYVVVENKTSFNDIAKIKWANADIQALANKGILLGKGNGKFDPSGNVTRAEFTTMLVRAFNLNATGTHTFNDVAENAWYADAVSAAKAYGLVSGRNATTFDPNAKISREEMATMMANALKTIIGYELPLNTDELLAKFVDSASISGVHRNNLAMLTNEGIIKGKGKNNVDPRNNATRAEAAVIIEQLLSRR